MILYRPVGLLELQRLYETHMRAFPPRLPEQPIFYPVLNADYAIQITRGWNTKNPPFAGYVTQFTVDDRYVAQFERHIVGNRTHEELWVPADQLAEFNQHIQQPISVIDAYFGTQFQGYLPEHFGLKGRNAVDQFKILTAMYDYNMQDFHGEITANHSAVFLHILFWQQHNFAADIPNSTRDRVVAAIRSVWSEAFPDVDLPDNR